MLPPLSINRLLPGLLLLGLLLGAAAVRAQSTDPGAVDVAADVRVREPIVEAIEWRGVARFDEDEIEARIVTTARRRFDPRFWREPPRLDPFVVEDDVDRILELYAEVGFFEAQASYRIVVVRVREDGSPQRVRVAFDVVEGPLTRLSAWLLRIEEVPGAATIEGVEREELLALVPDEPGSPFGTRRYRELRKALYETCGRLGFLFARIEGGAEVDAERHVARVDWTLLLGPRASVASIHLSGLDRVAPEVALRELAIGEGRPLSSHAIVESERRLMATGLFRSAVIGRPPNGGGDGGGDARPEGAVDLVVSLDEAPPRSFRASIGYGSEDGPRGEVGVVWRNFLGDARRLGLRAFGSRLDVGFEGSLGEPYLFGPRTRGDLAVSALRQDRPGYEAFVTGASAIATFVPALDGPWSFSFGPGYELMEIREFSIEVGDALRGPRDATIVNTFGAIRYVLVDDRLDPSEGVRVELASELGGRTIGSDLDYHRWSLDLRGYLGAGPFVLATRAAATTLDPIDGGRADVPLTRRLYSGGTNSVRGFGFQKLGPEDASNDPVGGLSRLELGTELRWRVWRPFSLVGFVDAGDVRSRSWVFRPGELRASAGPGLRLDTPVGPLRLDMGFLLNPPRDTDPWRIHLSVGHAF